MKEQIIEANEAYRKGTPIMSDEEYDILLTKYEENEMDYEECRKFKESLFEDGGDVKHDYIVGSLEKVRYGEHELNKFLLVNNINQLIVSEKIDGCSFVATYNKGKFIKGATRGDGKTGKDITKKLKHILPKITSKDHLEIRGELTLTHNSHKELGFKNRRNGTVGVINRDEVNPETIKHVKAIVYQIVNSDKGMFDQFLELEQLGFQTPLYCLHEVTDYTEENLKEFLLERKAFAVYDIDGLVISSFDCENENVYHPKHKVAFKVNSEGIETTVIDIEWNTSKNGAVKPVVLLEPIEIDGTTVKRCTGYNALYILDNKIQKGTRVWIIRSGEIIPKIIKIEN